MKTPTHNKLLSMLGTCLGQPLAWVLRKQYRLLTWLIAKGLSANFALLLLIAVNLFILVTLLFSLFPMWMTFIAMVLIAISFAGIDIDVAPSQPYEEWRSGWDGYGLYDNQFDMRIDGGSANDDNDPAKN